ncbi:MAG: hypothetical protein JEZ00_14250 [Anaerolineaceae bacterium]|nr:hypothetical protein [Anaerolineaceae bacterium]
MIAGLYTREQLSYREAGFGLSIQSGGAGLPESAHPENNAASDLVQISAASQSALTHQMQEVEFSGGWTDMRFDVDGDVIAKASYSINVSQRTESLQLSFTFTAESLGYTKKDFAGFGGEPIQIKMDFFQQSIDFVKEQNLTITQKNRTADEIIVDIVRSLREVFLQKGDETVRLHLDSEAFQTLIGNAQTSNMVDNIAALIGIINHMRLHGGPRNKYDIYVSGKGKPEINYQENVELKIEGSQISLSITILPTEDSAAEIEQHSAEQPVHEETT